ncbi:Flp1 family type IVb pilin [Paenibacillus sp. YYML68]|uniref:Flp1 family type IVb pilin n=1 Tax=Paenibacillus sp. YYML68 TaxID=2909250 RepID=UPI002492A835|nr:Flp1 family type IVb pilin [Paenibacillus sp. YYML68]
MLSTMKDAWVQFWDDEEGLGTLEILLIVAVLLIIAVAFRKWIMQWMRQLFESADKQINNEIKDVGSSKIDPPALPTNN